MPDLHARNVVLGAGAVGAAAAYHLAKRGEPVTLVEQFALGHDRGSSHGAARITRYSYADPVYARLMPEAFASWRTLEADAGQPFFLRTGGISVCPPGVGYVEQVTENLEALGIAHKRMTGHELNKAMPVFRVPDDVDVVFETEAGILAAARIVRAEIELARHLSRHTTILENRPVRRIDLEAEKPTLETDDGKIVADRLIVAAGPWTARVLPTFPVPLRPTRQQVLYLRPPDPVAYGAGRLPVFIYKGLGDLDSYYGMPAHDGIGVKVARHGGPETNPDVADPVVREDYRGVVRVFLYHFLPGLTDAHIEFTEVCLYTVAPGERFLVGPLAGRSDVIVASPCSGHGFKFSCLVGRVLADLATTGATDIPIDDWSLDPAAPGSS
jgi:sarcosine oxidase